HVLGEGKNRKALLLGERADPGVDKCRLDRRATRRIDGERHRLEVPHAERALDDGGEAGERYAGAHRYHAPDDAMQAHDGDDGARGAEEHGCIPIPRRGGPNTEMRAGRYTSRSARPSVPLRRVAGQPATSSAAPPRST